MSEGINREASHRLQPWAKLIMTGNYMRYYFFVYLWDVQNAVWVNQNFGCIRISAALSHGRELGIDMRTEVWKTSCFPAEAAAPRAKLRCTTAPLSRPAYMTPLSCDKSIDVTIAWSGALNTSEGSTSAREANGALSMSEGSLYTRPGANAIGER